MFPFPATALLHLPSTSPKKGCKTRADRRIFEPFSDHSQKFGPAHRTGRITAPTCVAISQAFKALNYVICGVRRIFAILCQTTLAQASVCRRCHRVHVMKTCSCHPLCPRIISLQTYITPPRNISPSKSFNDEIKGDPQNESEADARLKPSAASARGVARQRRDCALIATARESTASHTYMTPTGRH